MSICAWQLSEQKATDRLRAAWRCSWPTSPRVHLRRSWKDALRYMHLATQPRGRAEQDQEVQGEGVSCVCAHLNGGFELQDER